MFAIRSTSSNRELRFLGLRADRYTVALEGNGLHASTEVRAGDDINGLLELFEQLASYRRPWIGARGWHTRGGEFALSVTCTGGGLLDFAVELGTLDRSEPWRVASHLYSEFALLQVTLRHARRFFSTLAPALPAGPPPQEQHAGDQPHR